MMETDPNDRFTIEYKSILLDLIERAKTYERVGKAIHGDQEDSEELTLPHD